MDTEYLEKLLDLVLDEINDEFQICDGYFDWRYTHSFYRIKEHIENISGQIEEFFDLEVDDDF